MDKKQALEQIDAAIDVAARSLRNNTDYAKATTVCASTLARLADQSSVYANQSKRILDRRNVRPAFYPSQLAGVLEGLRSDIEAGYLQTVVEAAHADVFADLLAEAAHLEAEGFRLPAAVVAGAALEAHLRALADRAGISTIARGKPKRAGQLNDDLAKAGTYTKAEQKQVLAWQDLRNSAAHGEDTFTDPEVRLMTQGIRDFVARHPA